MNLKYWLFILLSFILLITVSFTYFKIHDERQIDSSLLSAVPAASPIILTFNNSSSVEDLKLSLSANETAFESPIVKKFEEQFSALKSLFELSVSNENSELIIVVLPTGATTYDFLYLTKYPRLDIYSDAAFTYFEENGFEWSKTIFRNEEIIKLESASSSIHLFQEKDLLSLSFSSVAVESSVIALKEEEYSFINSAEELRLKASSADRPTLFVMYEKLGPMIPLLLGDEFKSLKNKMLSFADVSVLNLNITESEISLAGYTYGEDKIVSSIQQERRLSGFYKIIPANSCFMEIGQIDKKNVKVEEFGYFKSWLGNMYAHFALESFTSDIEEAGFLVLEVDDRQIAIEDLEELNSIIGSSVQREYKDYSIYEVDYSSFINKLFPNEMLTMRKGEAVFMDQMLVLANTSKGMEKLIDLYELNQVLKYNPEYEEFSTFLGEFASSYFYFNPERSVNFANRMFRDNPLGKIGIQYSKMGTELYTNFLLQNSSSDKFTVDEMLWKVQLESEAAQSIHLVKNHYTNENELLVQDAANKLYLVDNSGEILWTREMESKIVGKVDQIDFFNNTKLQMIFATEKQLHIIDRNGNYVSPYPIKLSATPSAGLSLVQYDLRSAHRIFIPGDNGNIYGYYRDGKPLPGWNPKKGDEIIKFPIRHLVVNNKDVLVAVSENGTISQFDRLGENIVEPMITACNIYKDFTYVLDPESFNAVSISNKGILSFNSEGKFDIHSHANYIDSIPMLVSTVNDREVLISAKRDDLVFRDENGTLLASNSIPWENTTGLELFEMSNGKYIGIYSEVSGQILLMDMDGKIVEDFPMRAEAPYMITEINSTGEAVFLASDNEGLFAYRLRL